MGIPHEKDSRLNWVVFGPGELADNLLRGVPFPRCDVVVDPSCPRRGGQDSHSTWINQPGSGQDPNPKGA